MKKLEPRLVEMAEMRTGNVAQYHSVKMIEPMFGQKLEAKEMGCC